MSYKSERPISDSRNARWAKKLVRPIVLTWAVLAIIFTFADLQISTTVVNPRSGWARFLADYGQEPGLLLAIIALYVINVNREKPDGLRGAAVSVFLLLCIALSTHAVVVKIVKDAIDDLPLFGTYAYRILALLGIAALV
ncbi:MAG: hypothetical protein PVF45_12685, partial [Anaerolineae bacterium]